MTNDDLQAVDIALATEARAMYAHLLTTDEKNRIAGFRSTEELVSFLRGTPGWGKAARDLPPDGVTDLQFSLEMDRAVYAEYEKIYRFAEKTAKDFLIFIALRVKCRAILAALTRLASGESLFLDPFPPFLHRLPGYNIETLSKATDFNGVVAAASPGVFGETLRAMKVEESTGLPRYAEAAVMLEGRYYAALADFLESGYQGPDGEALAKHVAFRADLLNIAYLLRLRRFKTPPEKAREFLLPIKGTIGKPLQDAILAAPSDAEAVNAVLASRMGRYLTDLEGTSPEKFVSTAEDAYFRKVIHGEPTLSVAYAFLILKENECNMLKHVYIALHYGLDPSIYI